jgi:hypothetical protein
LLHTTNGSGAGENGTTNGSGNPTSSKVLKVNDLVQENGKTAAASATYKITSTKGSNRTVTFVRPGRS